MNRKRRPLHYYIIRPWCNRKYIKKNNFQPQAPMVNNQNTVSETTISTAYYQEVEGEIPVNRNDSTNDVHTNKSQKDSEPTSAAKMTVDFDSEDDIDTGNGNCEMSDNDSEYDNLKDFDANSDAFECGTEKHNNYNELLQNIYFDLILLNWLINDTVVKFAKNISVRDMRLMVLNFYIRHKLSQTALEDLLHMLNLFMEYKVLPETFASFAKDFESPLKAKRNYFCTNCLYGFNNQPNSESVCPMDGCGSSENDFFNNVSA
ncbi:uncharacterized protein LOC129718019 isoform X2 [Wyeomyia smithii]|uniref:uncharacterized protein LOC129718019 isoform X2 n=1 Tax=Wyeomyia smithii TaxID=174621 RepID=UPI002467D411|nr:uncharacterized protein LOC129718019 isoform X2 [Wyeomyia smithii]